MRTPTGVGTDRTGAAAHHTYDLPVLSFFPVRQTLKWEIDYGRCAMFEGLPECILDSMLRFVMAHATLTCHNPPDHTAFFCSAPHRSVMLSAVFDFSRAIIVKGWFVPLIHDAVCGLANQLQWKIPSCIFFGNSRFDERV